MEKNKAIEVAKELFKHYPKQKSFFVTSDKQAFFEKGSADSHERSLSSDLEESIEILREDCEEKKEEPTKADYEKKIAALSKTLDATNKKLEKAEKGNDAYAVVALKAEAEKIAAEINDLKEKLEGLGE